MLLGNASLGSHVITNKMAVNPKQWIPLQKQLVPRANKVAENGTYQKNLERRHKETIDAALKCGHLKYLNEELILSSQADNGQCLERIVRISLPSSHIQALDEIALLSCTQLTICNLAGCYIRDISPFFGCINLLKLGLSNNQVCIPYPKPIL